MRVELRDEARSDLVDGAWFFGGSHCSAAKPTDDPNENDRRWLGWRLNQYNRILHAPGNRRSQRPQSNVLFSVNSVSSC